MNIWSILRRPMPNEYGDYAEPVNLPYVEWTTVEEAAMVDGCPRLRAFLRIVLPLARPGISATAVYIFIVIWQEFMFSLTFSKLTQGSIKG